jgi:hypothetical protein
LTFSAGEETFTSGTCTGSTTRAPKRHAKAKKLQVHLEHQLSRSSKPGGAVDVSGRRGMAAAAALMGKDAKPKPAWPAGGKSSGNHMLAAMRADGVMGGNAAGEGATAEERPRRAGGCCVLCGMHLC